MRVVNRVRFWLLAIAACAGPHKADDCAVVTADPPAADAPQRIAAGQRRWLAGDLDGAIAELAKAGGDHRALALLARAYDIAGRPADAQRAAGLAGAQPEPIIPRDVSKISGIAISPDGAYVATSEWRYTLPAQVTVWDTLSGRVAFSTGGDSVAFAVARSGETLAVVYGEPTGVRAMVPATGELRWSAEARHGPEIAIDRRGTITAIDTPMSPPIQRDLETGKLLRGIPIDACTVSTSADGRTLVTGTLVSTGTIVDLDATPPAQIVLATATSPSDIQDRGIAPDGQVVAISTKQGTLELLARDGKVRVSLPHAGTHVHWLDDGTVVATDGRHITRWTAAGKPVAAFELASDLHVIGEQLAIGSGGHAVVRRGSELVVVQLATARPTVIARFGLASRATALAWSADGARLGIATTVGDMATWTAASGVAALPGGHEPAKQLGFDAHGQLVAGDSSAVGQGTANAVAGIDDAGGPSPSWRLALKSNRVFVRGDAGELQRFVEAPEELTAAVRVRDALVAAGVSGRLYAWNADTGAGLGAFAPGAPVSALALGPDHRTLAVGRETGGIELWSFGARTRLATLVVAGGRWTIVAPGGRLDGDPRLLAWPAGEVLVPGDAAHVVQHGLAGRLLAQQLPAIAVAPTPPAAARSGGCLPKELATRARPEWTALAGQVLSYCLDEVGPEQHPYCFAADLTARSVVPIAPPLAVLAPRIEPASDPEAPSITRDAVSGRVTACSRPGACTELPVTAPNEFEIAISDDGTLVAVGDGKRIETWDLAARKQIARFPVARWRVGDGQGDKRPAFLGHAVLALFNPCAGPCARATMYSSRGKELGTFPLEASEPEKVPFHDDVWVVTHGEFGGFAIINTRTGAVVQRMSSESAAVATSPDRLVVVLGPTGKVLAYDRAGQLITKLDTPQCR